VAGRLLLLLLLLLLLVVVVWVACKHTAVWAV
jgi:hypothetical protein